MLDLCICVSWFRRANFFTGESNIMDRGLCEWICLLQTLHRLCGELVDYCDVFISCLETHSDGTHSLQMIHWWASVVMQNFSKSVPMKKQTHVHLGWSEGEYIFIRFKFFGELFLWLKDYITTTVLFKWTTLTDV